MDIRNIRHMSAVTGQRLENAPQAGQVALLYAGVTMGLHAWSRRLIGFSPSR